MTYVQSKANLEESKHYLAGGVASSLRAAMKPTPLFAEKGYGAKIVDIDGNEYIDYMLAYGPLILGHAHSSLNQVFAEASTKSVAYGIQHKGEIELARTLCNILPCAEKVALSGSGTEAVMLALRLSRAYTGKRKVVRFHGHYHGWADSIFTSFPSSDMKKTTQTLHDQEKVIPGTGGQSENSLDDIILVPWNDSDALEKVLLEGHMNIAAVISEPVMCNSGCIKPKKGYLEQMRKLTDELGIVMILDEVITGFRLGLGGAHEKYQLKPDLVTVGKALGGGVAISAVAGKNEIMKLIEEGVVSHLGTLNGNVLATAAAIATINELAHNNGEAYTRMNEMTDRLVNGINQLLEKHSISGVINREGPVFHMMFSEEAVVEDFEAFNKRDAAMYTLFAELMLKEGVLVRTNGLWYLSTVHYEAEVEATLSAIDKVFQQLK